MSSAGEKCGAQSAPKECRQRQRQQYLSRVRIPDSTPAYRAIKTAERCRIFTSAMHRKGVRRYAMKRCCEGGVLSRLTCCAFIFCFMRAATLSRLNAISLTMPDDLATRHATPSAACSHAPPPITQTE